MESKKTIGNMYEFAKTWNPLGGECPHKCSYCSTNALKKRYKAVKEKYTGEPRLYLSKPPKGKDKVVFVCAQNDLFAEGVPNSYVTEIISMLTDKETTYFFQTKNPKRLMWFINLIPKNSIICTTIETNRRYDQMGLTIETLERARWMSVISDNGFRTQVTIEPIMDFDLDLLVALIGISNCEQVNIGADSKNNKLPEPSKEKIEKLIKELEKITTVHIKSNLQRLLK